MFPRFYRHLFWNHLCDNGARLQEDGHALRGCCNSQVVRDLSYQRLCVHGDKGGVLFFLEGEEGARRGGMVTHARKE